MKRRRRVEEPVEPPVDMPPPSPSLLDRVEALPPKLLVGVGLAAYFLISLVDMTGETVTNDELVHLSSGYTYVTKGDFRLNPEHPPLVKILSGLPLRLMNLRLPPKTEHWKRGEQWQFGYHFFYQSGNNPDRLLFWGRLPTIAWGLLLVFMVYRVSASLYGPRGGLISLVLAAFCPTLLAHGHLVTTDVPVAAALFLTVVAAWRFLQIPTLTRTLLCGLSLGIALATKFNAVMFLPALALIGLVAWIQSPKKTLEASEDRWSRMLPITQWIGRFVGIAAVAFVVLWGVYGFRYRASPDPEFSMSWNFDPANKSTVAKCIDVARHYRLLPEAYLNGFRYMHEQAQVRNTYAFGLYSDRGWWWYFPIAFLVKNPVPLLFFAGWGFLGYARRSRDARSADYFLVIPPIIYSVLAASSNINIGIRHIMPIYPFLLVLAGGIPAASPTRRSGWTQSRVIATLLLINIGGCLVSVPHLLAYFHLPSRLVWKPYEMLTDSNLDWGQELARLKRYMDRNNIPEVKLAYFGNGSPRHLKLQHERLPAPNMYQEYEPEWKEATHYRKGDYVAISALSLVGVLWPSNHYYYLHRFGTLEPVASLGGGAMLVYRIPDDWDGMSVEKSP